MTVAWRLRRPLGGQLPRAVAGPYKGRSEAFVCLWSDHQNVTRVVVTFGLAVPIGRAVPSLAGPVPQQSARRHATCLVLEGARSARPRECAE